MTLRVVKPPSVATFRFKPRYRGLAWSAIGVGGSIAGLATALGVVVMPLATGVAGVMIGIGYLLSPAWRLAVTVDDTGLAVGSPSRQRFRIAWTEVVRVIVSPSTNTAFVDGGSPERSLIVPGVGAPAPYDIDNRPALVEAILAHVPAERVQTVESLEQAKAAEDAARTAAKATVKRAGAGGGEGGRAETAASERKTSDEAGSAKPKPDPS